jgi:hypothetical protein
MTIDWFVWLTPLILLPIVALFAFVGCRFDPYGIGPRYPGLQVIPDNLNSADYFRVRWTFSLNYPSQVITDILLPATWPGQNPKAGPITIDINDPELMNIEQKCPHLVRCECYVKDKNKPQEDYLDAGQSVYKAGTDPYMIWALTCDNNLQYSLTPEQYK